MAKKKKGIIINLSSNKTILVHVQIFKKHLKYKKFYLKNKKYLVHDENNIGKIGNLVLIEQSKPISKYKSWILKKILKK